MSTVRSLYRKVQVTLDEAKREKASSLEELAENIQKRSPLNFTYFKKRSGKRASVEPCKLEAILKTVYMCSDLELLHPETARLTDEGRKATDPNYYDSVLRRKVRNALKKIGAEVKEINRSIEKLLTEAHADRTPTWDVICDELELTGSDRKRFHSHITLLGMSKGIGFSQKKIYLPMQ